MNSDVKIHSGDFQLHPARLSRSVDDGNVMASMRFCEHVLQFGMPIDSFIMSIHVATGSIEFE
ncbi:MAG: hypothetical protein ACREQF_02750 [Candidatus Binataceae bacterium]